MRSREITFLCSLFLLFIVAGGDSVVHALVANPSFQTNTIPANVQLLILPGFGNDSQDYISPVISSSSASSSNSGSLVNSLLRRGWSPEQIRVLPLQRFEWLQVFLYGCFDPAFWQGTAPPTNPAFHWYLQRVQRAIQEAIVEKENRKVVLMGHSAGGWLGRAALGLLPESQYNRIPALVTLGTPNIPHPSMDMTRGALRWTHETYPGAFLLKQQVRYLTVCGTAVTGQRESDRRTERFAFNSYEAVCGTGETLGDGTCRFVLLFLVLGTLISFPLYYVQ